MDAPFKRGNPIREKQVFPRVSSPELKFVGHTIRPVLTSIAAVLGTFPKGPNKPVKPMRSWKEFVRLYGGVQNDTISAYSVKQFFDNGGKILWVIRIGSGMLQTAAPFLQGLSILNQLREFNIVFIPQTAFLPTNQAAIVTQTAIPVLERHRAIYIVDPPHQKNQHLTVSTLESWLKLQSKLRHPNVVLYFPQVLLLRNSPNGSHLAVPSSGTMAGVIARTDLTRGVWKAPAGSDALLQGVQGLEHSLTKAETERLTRSHINPLLYMTKNRMVAWGARTLSSDPEWKYLPVRRLALFLESSLYRGTTWVVFEPNDEPLWAHIRQTVQSFMQDHFRKGAFQGRSPKEAYFVKCGWETMSPNDQASGIVRITLGFAPLKPAEFVILNIQLQAKSKRNR